MRKVTLYEITPKEVVADNPRTFPMYSYKQTGMLPDGDVWGSVETEVEQLPIHLISTDRGGFRRDAYIVMSRQLREILELPLRAPIQEAEYKAACALRRAERADEHRMDMARRVDGFNATSWWHRIWFVLKGGVI